MPILVGADEELNGFLDGTITLTPWIQEDEWDAAIRPYEELLQIGDGGDRIYLTERAATSKVIVNQFDRFAKVFDFDQVTLDASKNAWVSLDERFEQLGQNAVIVVNPIELFRRIEVVANGIVPDYLRLEAGELHYVDALSPIEFRDAYEAPVSQEWRHGVRLTLREGGSAILESVGSDFGIPHTAALSVGDLRDICVRANVNSLVRGDFPDCLTDAETLERIKQSQTCVQNARVSCSFAGDVLDVEPTKEWIDRVRGVLPDGAWQPRTIIETIPESGATLPRLAFIEPAQNLNVAILSNTVELTRLGTTQNAKAAMFAAVSSIAAMLHTFNRKGFAWLRYSSSAEIRYKLASCNQHVWQYIDSRFENGMFVERSLAQKQRQISNAFGFEETIGALEGSFSMGTNPSDKSMWYLPEDVRRFMEAAASRANEYFQAMEAGDPVEQYMRIQRTDS